MTPYDRRLNPYIKRMAQDMQIRNLAASTIDSYTWHVDLATVPINSELWAPSNSLLMNLGIQSGRK